MAATPPARDRPPTPTLPWVLVAIATAAAVTATTAFVYVLVKRTDAPGEVLREFYRAAHNHDCDAAFALLAEPPEGPEREEACDELRGREFPATVRIAETVLRGDVAVVIVESDEGAARWRLRRAGRTWRITEGFPTP